MHSRTTKSPIISSSRHNVKHDSAKGQEIRPGDVYWVKNMKFDNGTDSKDRPVIVVKCAGDTVQYLKCTSQPSYDGYLIMDLISAGLDKDSFVSTTRASMSKGRLSRKIGHLSEEDMFNLDLK